MEIAQIMNRLKDSQSAEQSAIKTAAADDKKDKTDPNALREALRGTLAVADTEKTASATTPEPTPTGDLMKLAEDLTNAEEEAMMKQASVYGAAMCDGFMARFSQYEDAANDVPAPKTAAQQDTVLEHIKTAADDPEFQKFAAENPDLTKEAFDLGYQQTMGHLVKTAEEDFAQGYDDALNHIHKVAFDSYKMGAQTINNVLRELQE